MDLPHHIINIFKTILKTMPAEAVEIQDSNTVISTFGNILTNLGYTATIISVVTQIVEILWKIYLLLKKHVTGQSSLEYCQD